MGESMKKQSLLWNIRSLNLEFKFYMHELWINFSFTPFQWRRRGYFKDGGLLDHGRMIRLGPFMFNIEWGDMDLESPYHVGSEDD
jgi:hypothetical protein